MSGRILQMGCLFIILAAEMFPCPAGSLGLSSPVFFCLNLYLSFKLSMPSPVLLFGMTFISSDCYNLIQSNVIPPNLEAGAQHHVKQ